MWDELQLIFPLTLLCTFCVKLTKAILEEEVKLLSSWGPGSGWSLLLSPGPFEEKPRACVRNGKNVVVRELLLGQISWVKDAGGRNIDDESCVPTADRIIRQARH